MNDASICLDGGVLVYRTPFHRGLVNALKEMIPAPDRRWDAGRKAWLVAPRHGPTLVKLTNDYLGLNVGVPASTNAMPLLETRLLDVRYIGLCKERGNGESSAFGHSQGDWSVVFPEAVLRAWFNAEARPGEAGTLYAVLGLPRECKPTEIKSAYRRLALQWHPDKCKEPGAKEQFIAIQHAYEVLSSDKLRARYDAGLLLVAMQTAPKPMGPSYRLSYRSPLRCGYVLATGREMLGRFVVETILSWQDIARDDGKVLSTSWPQGADTYTEVWS